MTFKIKTEKEKYFPFSTGNNTSRTVSNAFYSQRQEASPKIDELPVSQKYKKTIAFVNGLIFGTSTALCYYEPNGFPFLIGTIVGIANTYRVSNETKENLDKDWELFKKTAFISALASYLLGGESIEWTGIGTLMATNLTMGVVYIKRKIKE